MRPFGAVIRIFVMRDENTKPETWDILLRRDGIIDMSRHYRHVWRLGRRLVRQASSWRFRQTCGDRFFLSFFFLSNLRWRSSKTGPTRSFLSFVDVYLFVDRYLSCCSLTILQTITYGNRTWRWIDTIWGWRNLQMSALLRLAIVFALNKSLPFEDPYQETYAMILASQPLENVQFSKIVLKF